MNFMSGEHELKKYLSRAIIGYKEMQAIDQNAMALGVGELQLMEGAGHALAGVIRRYNPSSILILAGSGNNGGDGLVTARILAQECEVTVLFFEGRHISSSCTAQRQIIEECFVKIHSIRCRDELDAFRPLFSSSDLIVDALLGTGISGELREPLRSCVTLTNESGKPVISADIPTPGIKATIICAFHRAKTEGSEVHSIGIPILAEICTGPGDLCLIKEREQAAHKGDGGAVLIIGGGPYQGAPYLAGLAALRSGADTVRVASPVSLPFPDLIHEPLHGPNVSINDLEQLHSLCSAADVVVCGMGLGPLSHDVVTEIAPSCRKAVFDADALRNPLPVAEETLYTPHAGEFFRITGKQVSSDLTRRADILSTEVLPGTVLLKGQVDIISHRDRIRFNRTGTQAMTTGGTGDVLAGICGALLSHLPAFEAACIGAFVNGRAGEAAAAEKGYGLIAQDLLEYIPKILYNNHK